MRALRSAERVHRGRGETTTLEGDMRAVGFVALLTVDSPINDCLFPV
jgi:hypothetical protein